MPHSWETAHRAGTSLARTGLAVCVGWPHRDWMRALLAEAVDAIHTAALSYTPISDAEEVRGGDPARCFFSAAGGPAQERLFHHPDVLGFLGREAGFPVQPNGRRGTYSYYLRPGQHLAVHRDVVTCELVVITSLAYRGSGSLGGLSFFYPDRTREPLSAVRAEPDRGRLCLQLLPGQTLVMFGGLVPHGVMPLVQGQSRVVSVLCYVPADSAVGARGTRYP